MRKNTPVVLWLALLLLFLSGELFLCNASPTPSVTAQPSFSLTDPIGLPQPIEGRPIFPPTMIYPSPSPSASVESSETKQSLVAGLVLVLEHSDLVHTSKSGDLTINILSLLIGYWSSSSPYWACCCKFYFLQDLSVKVPA